MEGSKFLNLTVAPAFQLNCKFLQVKKEKEDKMRKLQGRKKDKVKVRTILNAMLGCSKYHHNIFCPINLHLAELSAGLVEGGEQVTGGDRGQADRVHRHIVGKSRINILTCFSPLFRLKFRKILGFFLPMQTENLTISLDVRKNTSGD